MNEANTPLISIIIPMYNQKTYIADCIESIQAQTYSNFEIIIVDDGSNDGSGGICDEYARNDERIRVFHLENRGVSVARNYGLDWIRGEWFCFVDADDLVAKEYLGIMYYNAVEYDAEISACAHRKISIHKAKSEEINNTKVTIFEGSESCIRNFISHSEVSMNGMVWNKLYRSNIFGGIRFDDKLKVNEDCVYTFEVMKLCNRACMTQAQLYSWFIRESSASHRKPKTIDFSAADVNILLLEKVRDLNDQEVDRVLQTNYVRAVLYILCYVDFEKKDKKVQNCVEKLKKWKRSVWTNLSIREKVGYYLVVYQPGLLRILRKIV